MTAAAAPEHPYGLSDSHESRCRRCGVSCHAAIPVNGLAVMLPGVACRFLEPLPDDRYRCTVYSDRFERAPWCKTVAQATADGLLAQDCPYVAGRAGYRGKVRLPDHLFQRIAPVLRRFVAEHGIPNWVGVEGVLAFVNDGEERWRAIPRGDAGWSFVPEDGTAASLQQITRPDE